MKTYINRIEHLIDALDSLLSNAPAELKPLIKATKLNPAQARAYNQYVLSADPKNISGMLSWTSKTFYLQERQQRLEEALKLFWLESVSLLILGPSDQAAAKHIRRVMLLKQALLILQDFAVSVKAELKWTGRRLYTSFFEGGAAFSIESQAKTILEAYRLPPTYCKKLSKKVSAERGYGFWMQIPPSYTAEPQQGEQRVLYEPVRSEIARAIPITTTDNETGGASQAMSRTRCISTI